MDDVSWCTDETARARGEPGIAHSSMASLTTALRQLDDGFDPVWIRLSGPRGGG